MSLLRGPVRGTLARHIRLASDRHRTGGACRIRNHSAQQPVGLWLVGESAGSINVCGVNEGQDGVDLRVLPQAVRANIYRPSFEATEHIPRLSSDSARCVDHRHSPIASNGYSL